MKGIVEQLVTGSGEIYLGIKVCKEIIQPYLKQLNEYLDDLAMERYTANRQLRDAGNFHITVVNPVENEQLKATITAVPYNIDSVEYQLVGLGSVRYCGDTAFYVVCESEDLQLYRADLGLGRKDLHVTLGFDSADVHGVVKDATTLIDIVYRRWV